MRQLWTSICVRLFRVTQGRRFGGFGRNVYVLFPSEILGAERIHIGDRVYIAEKVFLAAVPHTGLQDCTIRVGEGTSLGRYNHIYATQAIDIGKDVLTAGNVYISDNSHQYAAPEVPIMRQPIRQMNRVSIGDGAWIGQNACIIGASVGRQSVIGANSVVTRDVPDHCVAAGSPAVIVRRYDPATATWRRTDPEGSFLAGEA